MILEIAAFSEQDAIAAAEAGADRIELCDNYSLGGITSVDDVLKKVRSKIHIPVFAIIRPRGGNFFYNEFEYALMKEKVLLCKQLSFNGIVTGILKEDSTVDTNKIKELVALAKPLPVTFHRAFDETPNPFEALEQIIASGCKRILTSGQTITAYDGQETIKKLIEIAANRITIVPGGGIRSNNIKAIWEHTNATEFHSAARTLYKQNTVDAEEVKRLMFWKIDK